MPEMQQTEMLWHDAPARLAAYNTCQWLAVILHLSCVRYNVQVQTICNVAGERAPNSTGTGNLNATVVSVSRHRSTFTAVITSIRCGRVPRAGPVRRSSSWTDSERPAAFFTGRLGPAPPRPGAQAFHFFKLELLPVPLRLPA